MNQIESANWRCYVLLRGALYCFILLCGALSCSAAIHSPSWCSGYDLVHRQCSVFLFLSHSGSADQRFTRFQFSGGFLQIIVIILTLSVTKSWHWDLVFNNINVSSKRNCLIIHIFFCLMSIWLNHMWTMLQKCIFKASGEFRSKTFSTANHGGTYRSLTIIIRVF